MLVTIFVFVLFLFMIMLLFIYNLGVEREKNNKLLEENLLSHMESQQYEQILASVKELRIMKHDVKTIWMCCRRFWKGTIPDRPLTICGRSQQT